MGRILTTTVTFLEMRAEPAQRPTPPLDLAKGKLAILKAERAPLHFYRYLYDAVAARWHWVDRKRLNDGQLAAIIHDPLNEIYVLYAEGSPAGFAEVNARRKTDIDLSYFGLVPDYFGRRYGGFFLGAVIDLVWAKRPQRFTVNTCTLDHPRALPLYQRHGFSPYAQREAAVELLEG